MTNQNKRIEIQAPAKVNLFLDILGKRPDKYHDIRSLLVPVALFDKVVIETRGQGIETIVDSKIMFEGIPWPVSMVKDADNLTTRAARLLKETTGYPGGARIVLEKRIPIAGGLGGGSSDAAAVLNGLNTIWNTGLSREELMNLGSSLGSDVPALVHDGVVCMEGTGDRVTPVPMNTGCSLWMVLVNPGFGVSTTDIYSRYTPDLTSVSSQTMFDRVLSGLADGCQQRIAGGLFNVLQKTVFRKYPLLELIKKELEKAGAMGVLLSGTGATVFALVQDADHGRKVEVRLRESVDCPVWTGIVKAIG